MKHQVEPIYCYSLAPSGPALYILHSRYVHGWEGGGVCIVQQAEPLALTLEDGAV